MNYKSLLSTKLAVVLLLGLVVFLANLRFQQWRAQRAIESEKQAIAAQAETLEKKNRDLNQSLSYLNTPDFKERVARQQLNLKKNGEVVYSFSEDQASSSPTQTKTASNNFQKWLEYFTAKD